MVASLLTVNNVHKRFVTRRNWLGKPLQTVQALRGVTLQVQPAEALGIVGESGCGKSTLARIIMQLDTPDQGEVLWQPVVDPNDDKTTGASAINLCALPAGQLRALRPGFQMVFQNPYTSLNPRLTIEQTLTEPLQVHGVGNNAQGRRALAEALLAQVGLEADALKKYPQAFSGGQRQRIGIARALALNPKLLVADEPVSALDVSIQAQILNLFKQLQAERQIALLFIAHNLDVVRYLCDRVAVMYLGQIIELTDTQSLFERPMHPYTQALMQARPIAEPFLARQRRDGAASGLTGEPPSPVNPPSGCAFHPRCPYAVAACAQQVPPLAQVNAQQGHQVACIRAHEWSEGLATRV
ncbi:MAG: oligopeptide/dipeptide ABC transporter ATP-binding protein [Vampirovibrionales bacterium]|nr:oligopeptide/dipeptide ABC transporter ATP-binding protein [Vampirovibrionales bacterium]